MMKRTNIVAFLVLQATPVLFSALHVSATDTAKVVCGGGQFNKKCLDLNLEPKVASKNERYGARCCSSAPFFRSKLQDQFGCCVHGGTITNVAGPGLELAHIYQGEEWFCAKSLTFEEAESHCANLGARMCSEEELNNKCAKSTGCGLNGALVWASDQAPTPCPTLSPSVMASSIPTSMTPAPSVCLENVALEKPTEQSSEYQHGAGASSHLAVDGNTSGSYDDGSVSHTYATSKDPWWFVDLENSYLIDNIVLWNRNAYYDRLENFVLTISRDGVDVYTYAHEGIPASGSATEIKLAQAVTGDKVKVQLLGEEEILSLAEVQVFAFCGSESS